MSVTIQHIKTKGWTLTDFFASPDDDSTGEFRFYHIRFVFTKPDEKIEKIDSLEKEFPREVIKKAFSDSGLDSEDVTYYDDYIEINYDIISDNNLDRRLSYITKQLGASEYENSYDSVKIFFGQE
jgi:hypothetical protein